MTALSSVGGSRFLQRGQFARWTSVLGLAWGLSLVPLPAVAANIPMGVVFAGEKVVGTLPLANTGAQAVFFVAAASDCPCLTVQAEPAVVAARQSQELAFTYLSQNTGRFVVQVDLQGAEPGKVLASHSVTGIVAARSWVIRAPELLAKAGAIDPVVVDLRSAEKFDKARLPRSLNLQPFALKSHKEWKSRTLVLVDEGHAPAELMAQVAALRTAGFGDVRALEGGIAAWVRQGGSVEGVEDHAVEVAQITPVEFTRSQRNGRWRVVEVAGRDSVSAAVPGAEMVDRWPDLDALLGHLIPSPAGALPQRTLVIAPDLETYAHIEKRFGAFDTTGLFYLRGGREALLQFRALQTATAVGPAPTASTQTRGAAPSGRGGCGVCPH